MQSPYPFWQQLLGVLLGVPVMALLFGILARSWAIGAQGGTPNNKTVARQRKEVLAMMGAGWIVGFGEVILLHFLHSR